MVTIQPTLMEHATAIEALQQLCYPSLDPTHLLRRTHIESHLRIFPEGQHVALIDGVVVGMSATLRHDIDFDSAQHSFDEMIAGGYFTCHNPTGAWLYGADMSTHPAYRKRGIASALYDARKALIRQLNLRGMVGGGMVPGYRFYKHQMTLGEYAHKVASGEISDPTLTPQLRNGYTVRGIIHDYLHDAELGNDATLIVWDNPDYRVP
ncbi:MAG: GNAT family N-acetyltransferase [Roseiflexaceae bacterium]|jgi:GNAT superfamily N-acetyltransferase|nr:GNAT family N-acetyltransferase [Chloroflexaceae bacterium]MCE2851204.1 GNAT family N-acetyltransferase [Chloroflexaceae bacterium]